MIFSFKFKNTLVKFESYKYNDNLNTSFSLFKYYDLKEFRSNLNILVL